MVLRHDLYLIGSSVNITIFASVADILKYIEVQKTKLFAL